MINAARKVQETESGRNVSLCSVDIMGRSGSFLTAFSRTVTLIKPLYVDLLLQPQCPQRQNPRRCQVHNENLGGQSRIRAPGGQGARPVRGAARYPEERDARLERLAS